VGKEDLNTFHQQGGKLDHSNNEAGPNEKGRRKRFTRAWREKKRSIHTGREGGAIGRRQGKKGYKAIPLLLKKREKKYSLAGGVSRLSSARGEKGSIRTFDS